MARAYDQGPGPTQVLAFVFGSVRQNLANMLVSGEFAFISDLLELGVFPDTDLSAMFC